KRGFGLQVNRIHAALQGAATTIRFVLATKLEIELEEVVLKHIGIIKEPRWFVAGVVEGRGLGEDIPKRGLRIGKIDMSQRIPVVLEIEEFVFQAKLKFNRGSCAHDEINRLVEGHMRAEIFPQLVLRSRVGRRGR